MGIDWRICGFLGSEQRGSGAVTLWMVEGNCSHISFPPVVQLRGVGTLRSRHMASWREIDRVRKDAVAVRDISKRLLSLSRADFTDWEIDFLQSTARHREEADLTTRQSEKLLQIRDDAEFITEFFGFSVKILLKRCHGARLDLAEDDEEWILQRFEKNETSIKRKQIGRLIKCARILNLIEHEVAA